jgi:rhamnose transport system ATP-binding protein
MTPAPLLRLTQITKSFGAVRALRGVSFELHSGEVHALVGENGAGKSTLIRIITGAHQPDTGTLEIGGQLVKRLTPSLAHANGIAAIYQQPALFPNLSVMENLALGLEETSAFRRVRWAERKKRAGELLERVGAEIRPEADVSTLSMPQQQLVEIARALGAGARILIMDEPTASLTAREVDLLIDLIAGLRSRGVGIIYISHRLEEIFKVADRVTVLRDGETVGDRVLRNNESSDSAVTKSELIQLMVGREVSTIFPPGGSVKAETILQLNRVGCKPARLHDISFEVRSGEIVGLAGMVGAGRTELARALFGITPIDSGEMRLCGRNIRPASPAEAIRLGIAYVPEDRRRHGTILEMSVAQNVTMASQSEMFPGGWLRFAPELDLASKFVAELAIKTPSVENRVGNLSGGNQQKVALARWLATNPRLLILDEPTQGVDVGAKVEIHGLIRRLAAQGMAVLMISSELPEILGMSDRIVVLREGTVVSTLNAGTADPQDVMAAALGEAR